MILINSHSVKLGFSYSGHERLRGKVCDSVCLSSTTAKYTFTWVIKKFLFFITVYSYVEGCLLESILHFYLTVNFVVKVVFSTLSLIIKVQLRHFNKHCSFSFVITFIFISLRIGAKPLSSRFWCQTIKNAKGHLSAFPLHVQTLRFACHMIQHLQMNYLKNYTFCILNDICFERYLAGFHDIFGFD